MGGSAGGTGLGLAAVTEWIQRAGRRYAINEYWRWSSTCHAAFADILCHSRSRGSYRPAPQAVGHVRQWSATGVFWQKVSSQRPSSLVMP